MTAAFCIIDSIEKRCKKPRNHARVIFFLSFSPVFSGGARRNGDRLQDAVPPEDQRPREGDQLQGREHRDPQQRHRRQQTSQRAL